MHGNIHFSAQWTADGDQYVDFQTEHVLCAASIGCVEGAGVFHLHLEEFAVHSQCNVICFLSQM